MTGPCVILVAEDDERFRAALVDALRLFGYKDVEQAATGHEFHDRAGALLSRGVPFVFVVDNQMPEESDEADRQWCGLDHVIQLCLDHRDRGIGERVLFLSRWTRVDLPEHLRAQAMIHGLLAEECPWLPPHTPFSIFKARLDAIIVAGKP